MFLNNIKNLSTFWRCKCCLNIHLSVQCKCVHVLSPTPYFIRISCIIQYHHPRITALNPNLAHHAIPPLHIASLLGVPCNNARFESLWACHAIPSSPFPLLLSAPCNNTIPYCILLISSSRVQYFLYEMATRLRPHSQQNLAVATGYLVPHS